MRFMKRVIIAIAVISAPMVAYGNTFVIEGPNHHDFLRLVDEREGLRYSLYHIPSGMYR